jgi:predicted transposase YbfD/YdcC
VKDNQPALRADLNAAFADLDAICARSGGEIPRWLKREWTDRGIVFNRHREVSASHGRTEIRVIEALSDPDWNAQAGEAGTKGTPWPHLSQIIRLKRERTAKGKTTEETVNLVTSLSSEDADAEHLLIYQRKYWEIENRLHWVRDVTFGEDRSQVRSGNAPQVKAALTNLTMTVLRRHGCSNLAAALRTFAARSHTAIALVLSAHLLL